MLMLAAGVMAFAACDNDTVIDSQQQHQQMELRLSSSLDLQTRAAYTMQQGTQIDASEKVYAWGDEVPTSGSPSEYIKAWQLTADGSGSFTGSKQYYPATGNNVNIYAIHGNFSETLTEGTTTFPTSLPHTVATDQTSGYNQSDLLFGSATDLARQAGAHQVTFAHLLSKIEVYLIAGSGVTDTDLASATVSILGTKPQATVTLNKTATPIASVTASGTATEISALMQHGTDQTVTVGSDTKYAPAFAQAIIVPQWVSSTGASGGDTTDFIKVTIGTGAYVAKVSNEFTAGNKYTFYVTVNASGLTISSTITDWGAGTGAGSIDAQ